MKTRLTTLTRIADLPRFVLLGSFIACSALLAVGQAHHANTAKNNFVQAVRDATRQYLDVNNAYPDYLPAFGCVSGPDHGAMGIHYLNFTLVTDGEIDLTHPEALIYEPVGDQRRLVGVEYIVDSATWLANHNNVPPTLDDQAFQFVGSENRYGIPSFFELHVWAWRDNPNGAYVDWNNKVSCEGE